MSMILNLGFPSSIFTLIAGILIGLGITITTFGIIGLVFFFVLIYTGILRITPILNFLHKFTETFFPENIEKIKNKIQETFIIKNKSKDTVKQGIYCFHPHGAFSVSYFFHQMTSLTNIPFRGKPVVAEALYWLPWGSEILEGMNGIPNTYIQMKKVLEEGESLSVIPGGIDEMYLEKNKIKIKIKNRKGIFKLALETKTPLVPVISYGEENLYELADFPGITIIRSIFKKIGIGLPIPSFNTIKSWIKSTSNPIITVIGDPIYCEKEDTIKTLRDKYILGLKQLYKTTKPYGYAEEVEIL